MKLQDIIVELPLFKKVIGVGAGLFLLACLFVPVNHLWITKSFGGFYLIFDLPDRNYEIAWAVLAVEFIGILVVTGLLAYILKDSG